jgi:hypothetical protein
MDLFGQDLLDAATHKAVFGELPSSLCAALRTPEVGDLVVQLLDAGWRKGQLAARVAALPAGPDPVAEVTALLRGFVEQVPPDARWREEKQARERELGSRAAAEEPASEQARQQWLAQIRRELSGPRQVRTVTRMPERPACALCGEPSSYFVTREVRLCQTCVGLLTSGGVRLTLEPSEHLAG